jgi:2-dehydro-3-deoxyphosphogluconate aldolase / (4S)-4-hydroxy-2-oxoglutarate aldolase
MSAEETLKTIHRVGIVPVIRAENAPEAFLAVEAMEAGGIPVVEITMTVPSAIEVIRKVAVVFAGRVLVGAGTVTNSTQASECLDAGAEFLVSPGICVSVLRVAKARKKLAIPGALTPSELISALDEGAPAVKIFPCGSVGGAKHIKALRGPFPDAALIPTGGVNAANAVEYFAAGAFALGVGSELVNVSALRAGRKDEVADAARELVAIVKASRAS